MTAKVVLPIGVATRHGVRLDKHVAKTGNGDTHEQALRFRQVICSKWMDQADRE
jgi:hypothetical protein